MREKFAWTEIGSIPNKSGVYAWYYAPEITDYDLESTIKILRDSVHEMSFSEKRKIVVDLLESAVFQYFAEEPYLAELRGALKPSYKGTLKHEPSLSEALISRILDNPDRLHTIKKVLERSAPNFGSPLYLGMSGNLNERLKTHKFLINKYRTEMFQASNGHHTENHQMRDKSFAAAVASRNLAPSRLFVLVEVIDGEGDLYVDVENILNRIHFPLFGRN